MSLLGRTVALVLATALCAALAVESPAAAQTAAAVLHQPQVAASPQAPPRPVCLKIAPTKKPKKAAKSRTYGKRKTGCKKGLLRTEVS